MNSDWVDSYNGDTSQLGPPPLGFDGSGNSKYAPAQQPQGGGSGMGGTLSGLAAALMKYGSSSGTNLNGGGVTAGYGSSDAFGGSTASASGGVDYGYGQLPSY